jgi:predicted amidohydrolase
MPRVAACQLPDIRGDVQRSLHWIRGCASQADAEGVRLLVFPECFLQGYFTDEQGARAHALGLDSAEFAAVLRQLEDLTPMLVIGMLERGGDRVFNSAVVVERGELTGAYRKTHLLDGESGAFAVGDGYPVFEADGLRFGINICYDTQFAEAAAAVAGQGAEVIVCPANNMMRRESAERWKHLHNQVRLERVKETGAWLISADVTGQTEARISYGPTAVLHPSGQVLAQVPLLETGMVVADIGAGGSGTAWTLPIRLWEEFRN